ncbi:hypothetical protein AMATHDRAFT_51267 [Amanita thiersii Skay4041]|uniref:Uncharacterized protein n=1 Tax=Amanita thiersii Skay4041 TaxID=703135 RepID=A0A2A9N8J4_9AGAR|nr:hypothetical protein AMATHDRAFT_51267 [Amanita thiersii Skay4041]
MIRGLFWIAVSNFVFPVLLAIVELVFMFHVRNFIHGIYVGYVNAYVSIVGVLLATVWAASGRWCEQHYLPARGNNGLSTLRFTRAMNPNAISMMSTTGSVANLSTENFRSLNTDSHSVHDEPVKSDIESKAVGLS